mgnify:CR=1 FL=1|tara:strand:+ start:507 stop:1235 length:729 start_codon:yes stop_codon:yes gene_type:complete
MQEEDFEYAVLSKAAYDWYHGDHELAKQELEAYNLPYEFDLDNSDDNSVTVVRPDGSAVLSYRGTDITNPSDIFADSQIFLGLHSNPLMQPLNPLNRFESANQKYEKVKDKYPNLTLTGHSLGGSQALHVARKHGADSITFNPGSSPLGEMFHSILSSDKPQKIYTTGDDLISYSSYLFDRKDDMILVPKKEHNLYYSHSLMHFLPPRKSIEIPPDYINPIHKDTFEKISMCEIFPDLCLRR